MCEMDLAQLPSGHAAAVRAAEAFGEAIAQIGDGDFEEQANELRKRELGQLIQVLTGPATGVLKLFEALSETVEQFNGDANLFDEAIHALQHAENCLGEVSRQLRPVVTGVRR
jgi:hypothetical protein